MAEEARRRYQASEIYTLWRHNGGAKTLRQLPADLELETPRLASTGYCDIADFLLGLFGPGRWLWKDNRHETRRGRHWFVAGCNFAFDLVSAIPLARWHAASARRLRTASAASRPPAPGRRPLYLRMDHLFDLVGGGSAAHTSGVLNALRELRGPVDVLSTDRLALVDPDEYFHVLVPRYGRGRNLPSLPLLTYNSQVAAWWRGARLQPGFVYGRYSLGNYAALAIARREGVPYICEYNGSNIWIARNWDTRPLPFEREMLAIEDANLFGADVVVAVSQASKDELVERGVPGHKVLVNPNGVDPERFGLPGQGDEVRARYGISAEQRVIGFIGTFGEWHGTDVLAEAFVNLLSEHPDLKGKARLMLIGDGNKMAKVRSILESGGALEDVVFTGMVPQAEAPDHLAACDVLASPHVGNPDGTPFFGSPTKLFEYMAADRAVVASDLDQVGEVLEHERTALLVPPGDVPALAAGLHRLITEPELAARLAGAARLKCESDHSWMRHTQLILDALDEATGGSSSAN